MENKELRVEDYDLGGDALEAYWRELHTFYGMAIDAPDPARREMWELVGRGMEFVPRTTRERLGNYHGDGIYFFAPDWPSVKGYAPRGLLRPDPLAVEAISRVLTEIPEWAAAVEDARRLVDKAEVISAWSGVPIEVVLAVTGG